MSVFANWNYPTAIKFGAGRIGELPEHVRALGIRRPLLVTDSALAALPITRGALRLLEDAGLGAALFADVRSNPTDENLAAGVAAFRAGGHDGVIAFGGGSGLDLGKLVAFAAGQTRPIWDFEDVGDWWMRADAAGIAPIVAVPTTAGTGSEVGRAGVVTDTKAQVKKVIFHPKMMPGVVICDPELTVGMPPQITAGTGLDAFAHCLEAYCAPGFHPLADGVALEGLRLVKDYLPRAYATPGDIEARGAMMAAAAMGATAFQKGLGAIHALSHPIGALHDTHHGMTNAVVMPAVLEANRPAIEAKIERLAAYLAVPGGFDGFLEFVRRLRADLKVPDTLTELGVPRAAFDRICAMALSDPTAGGNPLPLTHELAARMLEAAFGA
ncbi:MAG TPA: iron-containing alcohol dehydrogenase [Caulobacteraceae bacterium]|jgi:alcohol dehydrogenase